MPRSYTLSDDAEYDVLRIWEYTREQYGEQQADSYVSGLYVSFQRLTENPRWWPEYKGETGIRSFLYERQYRIYYHETEDGITIGNVLHGSRDQDKVLERYSAQRRGCNYEPGE
jgi:toxin ParE1/3/4